MSPTLATNAEMLFDKDGDFVRYDVPDCDPVSIETVWTKITGSGSFGETEDELLYRVTWANGVFAEMHSIRNEWHHIFLATINARQARALAGVDAAIAECARPLTPEHNSNHSTEAA